MNFPNREIVKEIKKEYPANKIYKTVEQVCDKCGKHWKQKYCSDGTFEFVGEECCACNSVSHPVDGEPSLSQWLAKIKL